MAKTEKIVFSVLVLFLILGLALRVIKNKTSQVNFTVTSPLNAPLPKPKSLPIQNASKAFLIPINQATPQELDLLPKIGKKTAERIIAYREQNGPFKDKTDLLRVKGIGPSKYKQIEPYITIHSKEP